MKKDMRSELSIARDEWFESATGKISLNPATLGYPVSAQYLKNRLEAAFLAGAEANSAAREWMAISSAPKDGALIMVCGGTYGCDVDPWPVEDRPLRGVALVYWRSDSFMTGNDDDYDHYNPEYWMPVPDSK